MEGRKIRPLHLRKEVFSMDFSQMLERPRRLRGNPLIRSMVRETRVSKSSLIYPMFVRDGKNILEPIPSLDGQMRCSVDRLGDILEDVAKAGGKNVMLVGIPDHKDEVGSQAYAEDGVVQRALRFAKEHYPELYLITDVCMCEYTSHGHCGVLCGHEVDNDKTLPLIAKTALSHVQAGADMVAPSDMMDGRVLAIRQELDKNGFTSTPIMSYAVKYSSAFYGPFREAAGSAPAFGDRKSYQMDYHNSREGVKEALLDAEEWSWWLSVAKGTYNDGLVYWNVASARADGAGLYVLKRYYAFAQFTRYLSEGDVRVGCTLSDPMDWMGVDIGAFVKPDGSVVVVAVNDGAAKSLRLDGLEGFEGRTATAVCTDAEREAEESDFVFGGRVELAADSVTTFAFSAV